MLYMAAAEKLSGGFFIAPGETCIDVLPCRSHAGSLILRVGGWRTLPVCAVSLSGLAAYCQNLIAVGDRCRKNVCIATVGKFQFLAERLYRFGEIAHGDVGLAH